MARRVVPGALIMKLVVDNFAGGGGATTGIEAAIGRPVDLAINHDAKAIAMHAANHPGTVHLCDDVFDVDPLEATGGRPVALAWFSPDCTHFSKAKGGKPRDKSIRGLAWVVVRWAAAVKPDVIMLENVEEFQDWGPLLDDGKPCPERKGLTFRRWKKALEEYGYKVELRQLVACDYGTPTIRKRLFVIARRDGRPIRWPQKTHGPGLQPYRTAAECIDWSLPCPSIFLSAEEGKALGVRRPLAEATMRRIARGVMKYVVEAADPFVVPLTHQGDSRVHDINEPFRTVTSAHRGEMALVAPTLINTRNGERPGQAPRVRDIREPAPTVTAGGSQGALVAAFLAKHYGGKQTPGWPLDRPLSTATAKDHHALVTAFLLKYYGTDQDPRLDDPLHTITTKARFGLVTVAGEQYEIADIGMRMLSPRELFRAQGFPEDYVIDPEFNGKPMSKTNQIALCGNAVPPQFAEALVRANLPELAEQRATA